MLTRQDAGGFRPHVTVQNKVSPETARWLLDALRAEGPICLVEGLGVYVYVVNGRNLWDEAHFEMLFNRGQEVGREAYVRWTAQLAALMPVSAYERGLGLSE